jgi:spore germination protein KC
MLKKLILISFILILLLSVSGCWDKIEIQDLAQIMGAGIDLIPEAERNFPEEKILFTVEIARTLPGERGSEGIIFVSRGETLYSAEKNMTKIIGQELFWGHTEVFIIGSELAKDGLNKYLDMISENHNISPKINLIIADGAATEIFRESAGDCSHVSMGIRQMILLQSRRSSATAQRLTYQNYVIYRSGSYQASVAFPLVRVERNEATNKLSSDKEDKKNTEGNTQNKNSDEKENHTDTDMGSKTTTEEKKLVTLSGMAIIGTDGRLVEFITDPCTLAGTLLWLKQTTDFVIVSHRKDGDLPTISVEVSGWQIRKNWCVEDNKLKLKVKTEANILLAESEGIKRYDIEYRSAELVERCEEEIKMRLESAWQKAVSSNNDFLLIGDDLHKKHFNIWRQVKDTWPDYMPAIELDISVEIKLDTTGQPHNNYWLLDTHGEGLGIGDDSTE